MLIRYQDRRILDYGVFALKAPYYDSVEAAESTVSRTSLSGNTPATMTMVLEDGTILHTKRFVAINSYNNEFRIIDGKLYETIAKMMESRGHYGDILDILLLCGEGWSIYVHYYDGLEDFDDGADFFEVESVSWSLEKYTRGV